MAIHEFRLPDVGEGIAEGEILSWLVAPGDEVTRDQPVVEIETDKAVVEIPSPVDGTVADLLAAAGDVVPVGAVLVTFDVGGEPPETVSEPAAAADPGRTDRPETAGSEAGPGEPGTPPRDAVEVRTTPQSEALSRRERVVAPPSVRALARRLGVDLSAVEGSGPGGRLTEADVRAASERGGESAVVPDEEPEGPRADDREPAAEPEAAPPPDRQGLPRERTLAAPSTKRLARELGIDIDDVPADDEYEGEPFVTERAVREYAARREAGTAAPTGDEPAPEDAFDAGAEPAPSAEPAAREERLPYRGVRRTVGRRMQQSLATAPHVTHHDEVEVEALAELREEWKPVAEDRGARLTYTPFVVKAAVAALKRHPRFNASLDEANEEIVLKGDYNVGIAVATGAGLLVPVVEDADRKSVLEIAREIQTLAERARDRSITRAELQGSTFTITNYGSIGGEFATPIINPPNAAVLGLGRVKDRPWVVDDEVRPRKTLRLSLAFDHRIVDGADAAEFVNAAVSYLNEPDRLLLE